MNGSSSPEAARLSMNQATVPRWSIPELLDGCARAGYGGVGLWRDRLEDLDLRAVAKKAARLELEVTSLCRAGWFLAAEDSARRARAKDNRRAVDEAALLGARTLVVVCGPAGDRDLTGARRAVTEAVAELARYAAEQGVTLGIEPMHPLYCGDRSVIVTLAQSLGVLSAVALDNDGPERIGPEPLGVVLDSYHLWWDPELAPGVARAAGRILAVQLADWLAPPPHPLNGRGMLGDGTIDLRAFCRLVEAAGFRGLFEVEIFNPDVWAADPAETVGVVSQRYLAHAAP
jgi:sugar phosphate isomerase/epimerase